MTKTLFPLETYPPRTYPVTTLELTRPNDSNSEERIAPKTISPPRLGRTLKLGIRTCWDSLGFVCAGSLTLFASLCIPVTVLGLFPGRTAAAFVCAIIYLFVAPPIFAGICWLVHTVYECDEPSYADLWRGARLLYWRALGLGTVHLLGTAVLVANILFYLSRPSLAFLLLAIGFAYGLLFWVMNMLYHWPLLAATAAGILRRDGDQSAGLASVFRNGFLLTVSAPGYTFALAVILIAITLPLVVSGVGAALVAPGFSAFLTTQATRDQLVRFGVLPAPPDPDEPVGDERWRMR